MRVLFDGAGRQINKLRVSLTEACNFQCLYCRGKSPGSASSSPALEADEIIRICRGLVALGVDEIRLTGGEPTLRPDWDRIVLALSGLPLKKLGITTNGFGLAPKLAFLKSTFCRFLNVSLDSLRPERFFQITGNRNFPAVMETILSARQMGFPVKVNTVLLRDINDDEIGDFIAFSEAHQVTVRFLELMHAGCFRPEENRYISVGEIIDRVTLAAGLVPEPETPDSTAFYFTTVKGGRIGFIAGESRPFCHSCSRLRLTADGRLRWCLRDRGSVSLRGVSEADFARVVKLAVDRKLPAPVSQTLDPLYLIGG
jgi:cyclic pyranopterin phosphate synthase